MHTELSRIFESTDACCTLLAEIKIVPVFEAKCEGFSVLVLFVLCAEPDLDNGRPLAI